MITIDSLRKVIGIVLLNGKPVKIMSMSKRLVFENITLDYRDGTSAPARFKIKGVNWVAKVEGDNFRITKGRIEDINTDITLLCLIAS